MLDGEIKPDDYRQMKIDIENRLIELTSKQTQLKGGGEDYETKIDYCIKLLKNIDNIYDTVDTENKKRIIGSIFPERLIFENNKYRTPKINRIVSLICSNNGHFKGDKKEKHTFLDMLSCQVVPMGERSNFTCEDLHKIFEFLEIIDPIEVPN